MIRNIFLQPGVKRCWNTSLHGSYPILICTDDVLSDISITNVTWLIHYSINMRSRTRFNYRFSTLLENLQMVYYFTIIRVKIVSLKVMNFLKLLRNAVLVK